MICAAPFAVLDVNGELVTGCGDATTANSLMKRIDRAASWVRTSDGMTMGVKQRPDSMTLARRLRALARPEDGGGVSALATHLWLDDIRAAPEGWTWCKTAAEAITMLKTGLVEYASLDHDLAEEHYAGGGYCDTGHEGAATGYDVCKWMVDNGVYPSRFLKFHTANPVGRANMMQLILRYRPDVLEWRK